MITSNTMLEWVKGLFLDVEEDEYVEHDIQIDLDTIEEPYRSYIEDTFKLAWEHDVSVTMSKERSIKYNEDNDAAVCNGYFDQEAPELAVACGQDFDKWFSVFIHESCHMDQWIEQCPAWTDGEIHGVEAYDLLELWLQGAIELNEEQKHAVIQPPMFVELDCERRVVQKIKDLNLPIDPLRYAQRANSYVYFYLLMGFTRKWYEIDKEPYNYPAIVCKMPTHLDGDYSQIPQGIKETMVMNMYKDRYDELCR